MTEDADEPYSPTVPFYGKKVREIPCFRNSFLYGIGSGFGVGLACFLATSKVKRASDFGFAAFTFVTLSYWFHCRYQWSQQRFYYRQLRSDLEEYMTKEGTSEKPIDV